jgi:hypothetical protein
MAKSRKKVVKGQGKTPGMKALVAHTGPKDDANGVLLVKTLVHASARVLKPGDKISVDEMVELAGGETHVLRLVRDGVLELMESKAEDPPPLQGDDGDADDDQTENQGQDDAGETAGDQTPQA